MLSGFYATYARFQVRAATAADKYHSVRDLREQIGRANSIIRKDSNMSTDQKLTTGERAFLILVGIGIWLPIIGVALLYMTTDRSLNGALAFAYFVIFLAKVEMGGILLLIIYAAWVRPWRLPGKGYDTFLIYIFSVGLAVIVFALLFLPR